MRTLLYIIGAFASEGELFLIFALYSQLFTDCEYILLQARPHFAEFPMRRPFLINP